ncbi:glycosyltransferase family 4 protein [Thioclava electrotropha]|uniref:Glycosyltransferase n=1 Tax=Thioclava electrotropha TaxID=1549850 RepID=A0ABX6YQL2_9RHOB|nr:glycosyltransferase [Thioclava electrotropha]QPZ90001.1 glycosyltransferase [Thioclava electrotropha]
MILRETIGALAAADPDRILFVGSQGRGVLEDTGVPIRRYWYRRSRFRLVTLATFAFSQLALYRALSRADLPTGAVIYVNTLLPFGAALWAAWHGHTVVYHAHEVSISPRPLRWFLLRVAQRTATRVLYVSEDHHRRLPVAGVPATVLPNPVSARIATRGFATAYAPRRSGHFEVLMLASPRDFKGVPEFLGLVERFQNRPDIQFTLVLNGDRDEVAAYLPPGPVPGNVTIHPRTDRPEDFYATADVVANLSRVDLWIETFGLTIAEAMTFGLPVIAPPIGGPAEILRDGVEGFLVDSRDAATLADRVTTLFENPAAALAMSAAARQRARDFTIETFTADLQSLIVAMPANPTRTEHRV